MADKAFSCSAPIPRISSLSIYMPEVDGIEAVAKLKAEKSATKFIAISGGPLRSEGDPLPEALELGAGCIFGKPIDNKELLEASETLLGA